MGNRQQIEQRADVVREEPAGLLEGGQRAGFVATFHLHAADVVGHLGGQPQQILPEAGRRIAVSQVERGPLFHFRPERFLAFHQRGQINILLHDLGAVEHAVGLQIAVLAQRVGKVNGGQPAQVFIGGNEFLHEGGKTDLQQRLLALAVESQREILAVELGVGVAQRHHMHRQPAFPSAQAQHVVHDAVGKQHIAPVQRVQRFVGQPFQAGAKAAIRHRLVEHQGGHGGHRQQQAHAGHHPAQRLADARIAVLPGLPHHPKLAGHITRASGQNHVRRGHQVLHAEEVPRRDGGIVKRGHGHRQHEHAQENLPRGMPPCRLLRAHQEKDAPRDHRQAHHQQKAGGLRGVGNQVPLVAPGVPHHAPQRAKAAQAHAGGLEHPPRVQRIQQQAGQHAKPGAHQHAHGKLGALQHGAHHQQRGEGRKHPERGEFADAHPVEQPQRIEKTHPPRALVFREQERRAEQKQQVERAGQRPVGQNPKRNTAHQKQSRHNASQQAGLRLAADFRGIVLVVQRIAQPHGQQRQQHHAQRAEYRAAHPNPKRHGAAGQVRQRPNQIAPQGIQQQRADIQLQLPNQTFGRQPRKGAPAQSGQIQNEGHTPQPNGG